MNEKSKEILEYAAYIFLGYLIAIGANYALAVGLNTDYPVVAVVSDSMEHPNYEETYIKWFENRNYTREQLEEFSFNNGIRLGDLVVVRGTPIAEIVVGDVVVYQFSGKEPVIHRVVSIENGNLYTKGDNNRNVDQLNNAIAPPITEQALKGRAVAHIPWLGYVKYTVLKLQK